MFTPCSGDLVSPASLVLADISHSEHHADRIGEPGRIHRQPSLKEAQHEAQAGVVAKPDVDEVP